MFKGSVFTIGVLIVLGSVGFGVLSVLAGGMSDAPQAGNDEASSGLMIGAVGLGVYGDLGAARRALTLDLWSCVPQQTCRGV